MKLIFNIDSTGTDILKEHIGSLDADFEIKNMKSEIISITEELIELIGQDVYDLLLALHDEGIIEPENDEEEESVAFLNKARYVIACGAYMNYAPQNDISHTSNGRLQRLDDKQRAPWEWQIDRSNKQLERNYYKAIDSLIAFMDKNVQEWKDSDNYKATFKLIVRTTKDFDDYFSIERSRLLFIKLMPGLRKAEREDILPRLGAEAYGELKAKLLANEEEVDELLVEKVKEACVYKALAWGIRRLSAQLFPEGVLQYKGADRLTTQGKGPVIKNEVDSISQYFIKDAEAALLSLEAMLAAKEPQIIQDIPDHTPYFDCNDKFLTT